MTTEAGKIAPLAIRTVEESVVEAIRDRIVRGGLQPGDTLRLVDLSEQLGVSTLPVRQALRRLEAERLVVQAPRRGAIVAPIEIEDLEEIQAIRGGLEGLAARLGVACLEPNDIEEMRNLLIVLARAADADDLDQSLLRQWELYDICYARARRPRLYGSIVEHRRRAERYIRLALAEAGLKGSFVLQEEFITACSRGDSDEAERVISRAMGWTVEAVRSRL